MFSILLQTARGILNSLIFTLNDTDPLYLPIILTLQFFWGSNESRSNPISYKTIWHIPIIQNSELKLKNAGFFQTPFYFSLFFQKISHINSETNPLPHLYQSCLLVSETISCHKLRCCYSANILQNWVGGRGLIYFWKVDHSRISRNISRNWLGLNNLFEIVLLLISKTSEILLLS